LYKSVHGYVHTIIAIICPLLFLIVESSQKSSMKHQLSYQSD